jgi:hypothetical protein
VCEGWGAYQRRHERWPTRPCLFQPEHTTFACERDMGLMLHAPLFPCMCLPGRFDNVAGNDVWCVEQRAGVRWRGWRREGCVRVSGRECGACKWVAVGQMQLGHTLRAVVCARGGEGGKGIPFEAELDPLPQAPAIV